ncbi:MAG TPA: class I SAM-dependent methyltransferase [Candidatus Binataceae bacterium]|jgi:SAM-dependent methyltransferase|nr:class I SAM-dependent methyltransferase [Candidatus Binataceae bacterium]
MDEAGDSGRPSPGGGSMNWKTKAIVQRCLSRCPFGVQANYLLQRYVSRSLPIDHHTIKQMADIAAMHLEALSEHSLTAPRDARCLEIGAGTDLTLPLLFYAHGVNHHTTLDIAPLARRFLVNSSIVSLRSIDLPLARRPDSPIEPTTLLKAGLRERYGITYMAPCDARRTLLPAGSFDLITSTDTLEHIPAVDIPLILKECRRLLAPAGLLSLYVDHRDHYSYADSGISVYNFLRYSDAAWSRFNSSLQYQNRQRHPDYLEAADSCGFRIVKERRFGPSAADLCCLTQLELDPKFHKYALDDLGVQNSHIVLAPT